MNLVVVLFNPSCQLRPPADQIHFVFRWKQEIMSRTTHWNDPLCPAAPSSNGYWHYFFEPPFNLGTISAATVWCCHQYHVWQQATLVCDISLVIPVDRKLILPANYKGLTGCASYSCGCSTCWCSGSNYLLFRCLVWWPGCFSFRLLHRFVLKIPTEFCVLIVRRDFAHSPGGVCSSYFSLRHFANGSQRPRLNATGVFHR